eukprot:IDg18484t1
MMLHRIAIVLRSDARARARWHRRPERAVVAHDGLHTNTLAETNTPQLNSRRGECCLLQPVLKRSVMASGRSCTRAAQSVRGARNG